MRCTLSSASPKQVQAKPARGLREAEQVRSPKGFLYFRVHEPGLPLKDTAFLNFLGNMGYMSVKG